MAALKVSKILFLLLAILIVRGQDQEECEAVKKLKVCKCLYEDDYEDDLKGIRCSHVNQTEDIMKTFAILKGRGQDRTFRFEDTKTLADLPVNLFQNMEFAEIEMANVDLPFLGSRLEGSSPLSGLSETLLTLTLERVGYLHNWDWSKGGPMEILRTVTISDSQFDKIPSSFAKPFPGVVILTIENSKVHRIEDGAIPTEHLYQLNLQKNFLKDFSIKAFSGKPKRLTILDLSENQIESLDASLLLSMVALEELSLVNNKLFQVNEQVFAPWQGDQKPSLVLDIRGTRMIENCTAVAELRRYRKMFLFKDHEISCQRKQKKPTQRG